MKQPFIRIAMGLTAALSVCLGACRPATPPAPVAAESRPAVPLDSATASIPGHSQGKNDMSALHKMLSVFAAAASPTWSTFDRVPGVSWTDQAAIRNPDARSDTAFSRAGKLTLAGFGDADLPNGKAGPDADYVRGNEGASGVTLNGNEEQVTSIAVMKFHADRDYETVIKEQLGQTDSIRLVADGCRVADGSTSGEPNDSRNRFYEIALAGGATLFAEGSVDEEGGKYTPGSTTYFFYRSPPTERIQSMQCQKR